MIKHFSASTVMSSQDALYLDPTVYIPKKRIQFGDYKFVEIIPDPQIPEFRCCPSHGRDPNNSNHHGMVGSFIKYQNVY